MLWHILFSVCMTDIIFSDSAVDIHSVFRVLTISAFINCAFSVSFTSAFALYRFYLLQLALILSFLITDWSDAFSVSATSALICDLKCSQSIIMHSFLESSVIYASYYVLINHFNELLTDRKLFCECSLLWDSADMFFSVFLLICKLCDDCT